MEKDFEEECELTHFDWFIVDAGAMILIAFLAWLAF